MASISTGTDTTDLATTSSYGGDTVTEEDQSDTDSGSQDSDSQEGARKVKSHMSVLRCPKPSWISRIIESNRY